MNFKDAYKSYNDEIKGDPKVLDAILNGSKKENKKVFFIRPSFVGAMAAMVVIAVSVFGFNNFGNKTDSPEKTYIAATNPNDNFVPDTRIIAGNSGEETISVTPAEPDGQGNGETTVNVQTPVVSGETDNNPDNEVMTAEEEQNPIAIPDMPMPGRTVPSDDDDSAYNTDMVTTEDCYSYFGFSVTEKAHLPEDMTFGGNVIINAEKSAKTGELEYCLFSIDAYSETDPQRLLDVCVTKSASNQAPSDICYFTSAETGEITGGSFSTENISVKVNSVGLSQIEVEELLISLK